MIEGCREYTEGEDPAKAPWPAPADDWQWQQEQFEAFRAGRHRWTREADHGELHRFAELWPGVSAALGLTPYDTPRLIDCGEVIYPKDFALPRWMDFLNRHCDGDLGAFGTYPAEPLDLSTKWTISVQPPHIRARHAVDSGRGTIRSRFILSPEEQAQFPRVEWQPEAVRTCDITTVYADAKRTIVQLTYHPGGIDT
jgi:hypothetical protein